MGRLKNSRVKQNNQIRAKAWNRISKSAVCAESLHVTAHTDVNAQCCNRQSIRLSQYCLSLHLLRFHCFTILLAWMSVWQDFIPVSVVLPPIFSKSYCLTVWKRITYSTFCKYVICTFLHHFTSAYRISSSQRLNFTLNKQGMGASS